jgi:hypothetical protein
MIDRVLDDPSVLEAIAVHWQREAERRGRSAAWHGRPTIPMASYIRLMVVKQRSGWGYERVVREVGDSLHMRRFCRISLAERVPDESTIRKLTRRLGPEVVTDIARAVIAKGVAETRFRARAVRIDSTVVEADVRYPTDAGLAGDAVRLLAREGKRAAALIADGAGRMRDRTRAVGRKLRDLGVAVKRRTGEAKDDILKLTGECGKLAEAAVRDARRLAERLRAAARGRGAQAKLHAAQRLEQAIRRSQRVCEQIRKRLAGEPISDRLVSLLTSTPGRSARARRASRPSLGRCIRSPRSRRTRARGRAGSCWRRRRRPATPVRRAAAHDRRRPAAPRPASGRGRRRCRLPGSLNAEDARAAAARSRLHRRQTQHRGRRQQAHPRPAGQLPHRLGRPDQPPQTRVRPQAQPPQGRPRHPDMGRLERAGLQPRHLRPLLRPPQLRPSPPAWPAPPGPIHTQRNGRADSARPFRSPLRRLAVYPGGSS